ncbi:MAG: aminotransferase class V-fold PLP-dependent enzyme [Candidatus Omnitrophica bacterium]|nr:aminotransferase class V-fold PLP-dependent enzyme [Candidatus Omnitrophota bacterium]
MIYADNNATTPVSPEVLRAMEPYWAESYGNPSSLHPLGDRARKAIGAAREAVAAFLGAKHESEIVFTSGGTESNNLALQGVLKARPEKRHLITTSVEHPSVRNVFSKLAAQGYRVTSLEVNEAGILNVEQLKNELSEDTALVSVMAANNETGVLFPVERIAGWVKQAGAYFHVDAVQIAGKISFRVAETLIDFLSISGHKFHAPKGIGALYVRKGVPLEPFLYGGSQEGNRRAGTENVAAIAGLAEACRSASEGLEERCRKIAALRDRFDEGILKTVPDAWRNGGAENRVANTTSISFGGLDSESVLLGLGEEGICASSGSACRTGSVQLSHVLLAMGFSEERVRGAVRFSFGRFNTAAEIDEMLAKIPPLIQRLRIIQNSGVSK